MNTHHTWKFFRAGGFDQVRLDSGADLMALDQLDQKLWVALACPTTGLHFDAKTLALIDTDKDGRVRAPEVIAAVKWAGGLLKNPDDLIKGEAALSLSAINDAVPKGKALLNSARQILANIGKKDAASIALEDTSHPNVFASPFNGDGVVTTDATNDMAILKTIEDIIACMGAVMDRSGKPGVDQAKVDAFFAEAAAFSDWQKKAETDTSINPLAENTPAAVAAYQAVKTKVDDYFTRCRLAAFDPRALGALNRKEEEYLAIAAKDMSIDASEVAGFPLATVGAGKPLPLKTGLNPAWASAVAAFQAQVVGPLLGDKESLTEADWATLSAKLAPHQTWVASKAGAGVETLGLQRVREILGSKAKEMIGGLIAQDKAKEPEANAIESVEKLIRYQRDLHLLCANFVNFKDFYDRGDPAIFQAGPLYLDQRSCELTLPVEDAVRHGSMAGLAGTYLAYCDCTRKGTGEKRQIVAAFTGGDSDNLMVGRNGLFYDRNGVDWDATITKIVDNPISIRQAFWSPYKKLVRMIEEQVAKRAAAAEAASTAKLEATATAAASVDKAKPAEPKKVDVGTVAALGVAFGALATAFAALAGYFSGLLKLPFWQVCLAIAGLLLLISGPSMIIAYIKLRKRNLGPILDANGWAVNARAKINVPFGAALTKVAHLPPGARRSTDDKFGDAPSVWPKLIAFLIAVCFLYSLLNHYGLIHRMTGGQFGQQAGSQTNSLTSLIQIPSTNAPGQ